MAPPCVRPLMSTSTLLALALLAPAAAPPGPNGDLYGDPLPAGALARLGSLRLRSADPLNCIAFAPDGKTLVSGGSRGRKVLFWDVESGREKFAVTLPEAATVSSIQF